jgi:peptidoglycan/xylan/chitin deacetylase (PgdA/CDA1 family)
MEEMRTARRSRPVARGSRFTPRFYGIAAVVLLVIVILVIALVAGGGGSSPTGGMAVLGSGGVAEFNRLKVNEMGTVMVLEYHIIGAEDRWARSPENFRSDLETLYAEGYRCVSLKDYATNNITVAAGFTPVIFTFDDSAASQFKYILEGDKPVIDPTCAVGIMEDFDRQHPDFNMTATFYVLPSLFGQEEYAEMKLKYLAEHGYDIGNHTVNHSALSKLTSDKATQEIAGNIDIVRKYLPGYEEKSIALPLGEEPKEQAVLASGQSNGTEYRFVSSLLVGSNPAPAPNDRDFNPMRMPRVQALALTNKEGSAGSESWFQYFRDNPERRYRSDGDPNIITIPKHVEPRVNQSTLGDKRLRTY